MCVEAAFSQPCASSQCLVSSKARCMTAAELSCRRMLERLKVCAPADERATRGGRKMYVFCNRRCNMYIYIYICIHTHTHIYIYVYCFLQFYSCCRQDKKADGLTLSVGRRTLYIPLRRLRDLSLEGVRNVTCETC